MKVLIAVTALFLLFLTMVMVPFFSSVSGSVNNTTTNITQYGHFSNFLSAWPLLLFFLSLGAGGYWLWTHIKGESPPFRRQ